MRLCAARNSSREQHGTAVEYQRTDQASGGKNPTAEKLLVAASELMIERSSIEVSLSDIAQKSGVNAALVKYHFGNKDGLLLALLARDAATEMSQPRISAGAADHADRKTDGCTSAASSAPITSSPT